ADLERARDRLLATGCFETVGWRHERIPPDGVEVTFEVGEPHQFFPWMLDRVPVTREEFAARAGKEFPLLRDTLPPSETVLEKLAAVLQTMAQEKGLSEPMAGRLMLVGKDQLTIVLGPKAPPPNIADVRFTGTKALRPDYLRKVMLDLAMGTPFFEPNFRFLLDAQVRPYFDAAGRLRASWKQITAEKAEGIYGVIVTVEVEDGPVYRLEKIQVRGTPFSEDEIQEIGQFKPGEPAGISEIGKGIERILDRLREKGHMKASYRATRRIDDANQTVELFVDVDPGPVYTMGRLQIKGLDLESEPVIRKLWAVKPGEPYPGGYAESFVQRVRAMDLFDFLSDIKTEVKVDEKSRSVDVLLVFVGEKPKPAPRRPF
ncbi:MAG: POTRA domain-containing protein, partial [Bryobacteraceae bacterium]